MKKTIRILRLAANMPQTYVASKLNVATSTYIKYENGTTRIPADKLKQFCDLVGEKMDEVVLP